MSPGFDGGGGSSALRVAAVAAAMLACALVPSARAYPPEQPVPIPYFTFDAQSPTVINTMPGVDPVRPDAVLTKGPASEPVPVTVYPGQNLGLGLPGDELDGISFNRTTALRTREFVILFSVDRATTGEVPADPGLAAGNAPFNVADQVARGHAAGDGFIDLLAFDKDGVIDGLRAIMSNTQVINNYDEGGQDYQALPSVSSAQYVPGGTPQDNVGGSAYPPSNPLRDSGARERTPVDGLYFTVTRFSQSLQMGQLPGNSGADIFFDPRPDLLGLQRMQPYAFAGQLGLNQNDDVDSLLIDDSNSNGYYDGNDCVYLSLTPDSPSLMGLPFASSNGAADLLRACASTGGGGPPGLHLYASSEQLGLAGQNDDVDAVDVIPCGSADDPCDPVAFAAASSLRFFPGDWDNDGDIGPGDSAAFAPCLSGPHEGIAFALPPALCRDVFDFNVDEDVELVDFAHFQVIFDSHPGGP